MRSSPCRSLLLILALAPLLPAQDDEQKERGAGGLSKEEREELEQLPPEERKEYLRELRERRRAEAGEESGKEKEDADTPRGPGALGSFMRAIAAPRPYRIAPGASGEIHLALVFKSGFVVRPGDHFTLALHTPQGPIELAGFSLDDPKPGSPESGFAGQPIYEDSATFVVPFSVASDARYRSYPVHLRVEADLTQVKSGQPMGRYAMGCTATVEVGDPLPVPKVRRPDPALTTARIADTEPEPVQPAASAPAPQPQPAEPAATGPAAQPVQPVERASDPAAGEPSAGPPLAPPAESGLPVGLIGAAAALVLIVGLLALKRR